MVDLLIVAALCLHIMNVFHNVFHNFGTIIVSFRLRLSSCPVAVTDPPRVTEQTDMPVRAIHWRPAGTDHRVTPYLIVALDVDLHGGESTTAGAVRRHNR